MIMVACLLLLSSFALLASSSSSFLPHREPPPPPSPRSVLCATCVLAVREIRGLGSESVSEEEIRTYLKTDVCPKLSTLVREICDGVADNIALIMDLIDVLQPGAICEKLKICPAPPRPTFPDMRPIPDYTVNLDLPAKDHFSELVNQTSYWNNLWLFYETVNLILSEKYASKLFQLADDALNRIHEPYRSEMEGIASSVGLPRGIIFLLNLFYIIANQCTSLLAQRSPDGPPLLSRNLDQGFGSGLTDLMRNQSVNLHFVSGGEPVFEGVGFAGFVGIPTAQIRGKLSIAINSRDYFNMALLKYWETILEEIASGQSHLPTWVVRNVLQESLSFNDTVDYLKKVEIATSVYYIVAGNKHGEGVIIGRNQTETVFVETLGVAQPGGEDWFLLRTNFDPGEKTPFYDNRRYYGMKAIREWCGAEGQNISQQCLWKTLSTHPVLDLQTIYSSEVVPGEQTPLVAYLRYCHDEEGSPCSV